MAKFYANENFPLPVVEELRRLGHDVLTTYGAGEAGKSIPDTDVLKFATAKEPLLFTLNRKHFIRLHKANPDHVGLVVCTFDSYFTGEAIGIHQAIDFKRAKKKGTVVQKVHGSGVDSSGRRQNAVALGLFQWLSHPRQKVPGMGATCHHRW